MQPDPVPLADATTAAAAAAAMRWYALSSEQFSPAELLHQTRRAADAGFDEDYVSQVGPDMDGFFDLYATKVLPKLQAA